MLTWPVIFAITIGSLLLACLLAGVFFLVRQYNMQKLYQKHMKAVTEADPLVAGQAAGPAVGSK